MTSSKSPTRRACLLAAASLTAITLPASAAVKTWDGEGDANWQTAANWDANTAPLAGDSLVFQGAAGLSNSNNFPAATRFAGISFATGAGAFTLAGNAISLGGNVSNNSANTQTVGPALAVGGGTFTFTGSATTGATLALGGVTAPLAGGGAAIFTPNAGTITTTATNTNGILGGWATTGTTTNGVNWAMVNGSNQIVANSAYTDVAAAATITSNPTANIRMLGLANLGGVSADINTLKSSAAVASGNDVTNIGAGNTLRFGVLGGILNDTGIGNNMRIGGNAGNAGVGNVTAGGPTIDTPGTLVLNASATASTHNNTIGILSTITDNGTGAVTIVKTGLSSAYFQSANTYSGGTWINQGHIQANIGTSFGSGAVHVTPGGQAFLNATSTFANNLFISGTGPTADNTGALRLSNATTTGTITLEGNARVNINGNATAPTNGLITGPYSLEYYANGGANTTPVLVLGNTGNNWTGGTTITAAPGNANLVNATLRLGASEVIPHGSSAGNVTLAITATSTTAKVRLDLNGFAETINGLNSAVSNRIEVTNSAVGPATLTLGSGDANGDFGGTLIDTTLANAISLVKTGSGTQIIRGGTTVYFGTTTVNAGRLEFVGDSGAGGMITVAGGATFAAGGNVLGEVAVNDGGHLVSTGSFSASEIVPALTFGGTGSLDVSTATFPLVPLTVNGALTASGAAGSVTINVNGAAPAVGQYPLISYAGGLLAGTGFPAFKLGVLPPRITASLLNDTGAQAIVLNITSVGDSPVWSGALSSEWSTATLANPKNWVLSSNPATKTDFLVGDTVVFNDNATNNAVNINVADVAPGSVSFRNDIDTYTVTGTKGIVGSGGVIMDGDATTILATTNAYSGDTVISSGTLQVGNGGTAGSLGSSLVVNDAVLTFNRSDASTQPNSINGSGELRHTGSGTTTLSGLSTYSGKTTVSAGTVRVASSDSLGSASGNPVQVLAGGAVDVSGNPTANLQNFGAKQFLISGNGPSGNGVLVNVGAINQQNAFQQVKLEADASVGGTARFDIRGGPPTLDLNGHTLRKRGTNQFTLVDASVINGGAIIVEQGTLAMEALTSTLGSGSVTYEAGTQAQFYQNVTTNGGVTWPLTIRDGVALGNAGGVLATVPAPITLEGNVILVPFAAGVQTPASNFPITLSGAITESGGARSVTKNGVNVVTLTGTASYTGATTVNAGTLAVNSPGALTVSPVTVAAAATLGGTGSVAGAVTGNGIVSPGLALIGNFSTGATSFSGTGSLAVQIDSTALTADKLAVAGALNLGGATLAVTDLGAATLAAGVKFTVASYTGALTGAFANVTDGGTLTVGPNTFKVDYNEVISGQTSVTLTSVASGGTYDDWATAMGLNGSNNGKLADPDGDGLENIIEFGLDQDPLHPGNGGKIRALVADVDASAAVDNAFTLTVAMRSGATFDDSGTQLVSALVDGVVYRVQGSLSLADFTTLDISEVTPALSAGMPTPTTGWSYRSFRLPGSPSNPNPKAFLRVDVAETP